MADTYYTDTDGLLTIDKDPDAVLDYSQDWSAWLTPLGDTITGAPVWTAGAGLTVVSQSNNTTAAIAFISGGQVGNKIPLACRIVTAGGRTDERTVHLKIVQR
jgi:hypothetical protein